MLGSRTVVFVWQRTGEDVRHGSQVEAVHYSTSRAVLQQRSYSVSSDVKWGCRFAPVVSRPQAVRAGGDGKPHVSWDRFHTLVPVDTGEMEGAIQGAESGARSRTTSQLSEAYE